MTTVLIQSLYVTGFLLGILAICLILRWIIIRYAAYTNPPSLWWVTRDLDKKARQNNNCSILSSFLDTELLDLYVELVNPTCESGLPHTSDANTIRMSEDIWNSNTRNSILKHERVHIVQRRFPDAWNRFYKEKWGYELHREPPNSFPDAEKQKIRSNPDTAAIPWAVWQNRYWIVPLYKCSETPTLLGVNTSIWDSENKEWKESMPQEWRSFFCGDGKCPHQWEHPHEIAAELWTADMFDIPAGYFLKEFMQTFMTG